MRKQKTIQLDNGLEATVKEMTVNHIYQCLALLPKELDNLTDPDTIARILMQTRGIQDECVVLSDGSQFIDAPVSVLLRVFDVFVELHADFFGQVMGKLKG